MLTFLKRIVVFIILGFLIGEIIARLFVLNSDVPRREINAYGIQSYIPNQKGWVKGRAHQWQVNKTGWTGELPNSFDNLVTIIGDSFIENFMSPDNFHQNVLLKKELPKYNFFEAARSGVSLIEAMEISKQLDSLNPKLQLIYIHDSDLRESITQIQPLADITQVDLDNNKIVFGKMKLPTIKLVLYNWKFMYYLYNRFSGTISKITQPIQKPPSTKKKKRNYLPDYKRLLHYIQSNYDTTNKVLVFRPESDEKVVALARELGYLVIWLNSEGESKWTFDYDHHWTSFGHQRVAMQVAKALKENKLLK